MSEDREQTAGGGAGRPWTGAIEVPSPRGRGLGGSGARRGAVLAKAAQIFAEKGFAATTLRDIADALEISRPSIYYYFSSKEEILDALVQDVSMEAATTIPLPKTADAEEYRSSLRAAVRSVYLYVAARPGMFRMLTTSELQLPEGIAQHFQTAKANFVIRLTQLIDAGMAANVFRKVDASVAALGIMSMATMRSLNYPDPEEGCESAAADLIADMAVRSVDAAGLANVDSGEVFGRLRQDIAKLERLVGGR